MSRLRPLRPDYIVKEPQILIWNRCTRCGRGSRVEARGGREIVCRCVETDWHKQTRVPPFAFQFPCGEKAEWSDQQNHRAFTLAGAGKIFWFSLTPSLSLCLSLPLSLTLSVSLPFFLSLLLTLYCFCLSNMFKIKVWNSTLWCYDSTDCRRDAEIATTGQWDGIWLIGRTILPPPFPTRLPPFTLLGAGYKS